jgi:hypothetical protein
MTSAANSADGSWLSKGAAMGMGVLLLCGTLLAQAAPGKRPGGVVKVAGGKGSQVRPTATRLSKGTLLLAFERLLTAHRRRVYVQRRRPGLGWSWARAVPLTKGDFTQRDPSLVVRGSDEVLLYLQVGDLRRRRAAIRVYRSRADSLRWRDAGRLNLGLGARPGAPTAVTQPFAAPDGAGGVLLTVTRRFAGAHSGCHLARAADGLRFGPLGRIGAGTRCRVVAAGPRQLVVTYQTRTRRRLPWRSYFRRSADGGKTWSKATPVSALRTTSEAHPLVRPDKSLLFLFVATLRQGSAIQSATWTGARRVERRLTRPRARRDIAPFGLATPGQTWLFFAREVRPLDFDVLGRPLGPRRSSKRPQTPSGRP